MSKAAEERRKEKEAATLAQLAAQEKRAEEVRPAFFPYIIRMIRMMRMMMLMYA